MAVPPPPSGLESLCVDVEALRRRSTFQHRVQATLDPAWIGRALAETDAVVRESGEVDFLLVLPADGAVVASGRLQVNFEVPCGRCLEPALVEGTTEIHATFVVGDLPAPRGQRGEDEDEPGLGLSDDDLDVWTYDGHLLHLDELVIEQIRLAYPMRALCELGERCEGLCSRCGTNLNGSEGSTCPNCGAPRGKTEAGQSGIEGENPLARALKNVRLPE